MIGNRLREIIRQLLSIFCILKKKKCVQIISQKEEIESHLERVSSIKPFINLYNWEGTNYPSKRDDWKSFEKNNPTNTLNILYVKEEEICPVYIPKINSNCEKQIILLMIQNEEKEDYGLILQ